MRDPAQLPENQHNHYSIEVDEKKFSADRVSFAIGFLARMTDEERRVVFESFCTGCGGGDPNCEKCWLGGEI